MDKEKLNIEFDDLIVKFLSGNINSDELTILNEWRSSESANENYFNEQKKIWDSAEKVHYINDINLDTEWINLSSKLDFSDKTVLLPGRKIKFYYSIAAAIMIIMLSVIGYKYFSNRPSEKTIISQENPIDINLPDGSSITLNAMAEIGYPDEFKGKTRNIHLKKGEAFFNVTKDSIKPFIVETEFLDVKVLGTSFCVTVDKSGETSVNVASGVVEVINKKDNAKKVVLHPGDKVVFSHETKKFDKSVNLNENYIGWKTKKLVFKNDKLSDIIKDINKTYNCNIIIQSEKILDCRLTTAFENQSLESVLNILQSVLNLNIKYTDNSILISGEGC
ncbi:MAG: FecR domain-containing protein [Bacteroidota bacterium]